ncbi:hypothetical protein HPHPH16_0202 [Helicobacter pylori Hp H-16]|nr:hypothetical protein HPHPH16_0202 [Helicobacter pylori Hp H-16]
MEIDGNDWGTNWNGGLKNKALRSNASLNQLNTARYNTPSHLFFKKRGRNGNHSIILSFYHSIILSFYHSIILSFYHSIILSFYHSIILSFYHSIILAF